MKIWQWQKGRQSDIDYFKFTLWYFKIFNYGFDAYILKYDIGTLPMHKDIVPNGEHHRINITLRGDSVFMYKENNYIKKSFKMINVFRPDKTEHGLIVFSKSIKLSFGFVKFL